MTGPVRREPLQARGGGANKRSGSAVQLRCRTRSRRGERRPRETRMLYLNRRPGEAVIINHRIEVRPVRRLSAGDDAALDRG